jgi:hypothetical protein
VCDDDDAVRTERLDALRRLRQRPHRFGQYGGRHACNGEQDDFEFLIYEF